MSLPKLLESAVGVVGAASRSVAGGPWLYEGQKPATLHFAVSAVSKTRKSWLRLDCSGYRIGPFKNLHPQLSETCDRESSASSPPVGIILR